MLCHHSVPLSIKLNRSRALLVRSEGADSEFRGLHHWSLLIPARPANGTGTPLAGLPARRAGLASAAILFIEYLPQLPAPSPNIAGKLHRNVVVDASCSNT